MGVKHLYELVPAGLKKRIKQDRRKLWDEQQSLSVAKAWSDLSKHSKTLKPGSKAGKAASREESPPTSAEGDEPEAVEAKEKDAGSKDSKQSVSQKLIKEELQTRVDLLKELAEGYDDPGTPATPAVTLAVPPMATTAITCATTPATAPAVGPAIVTTTTLAVAPWLPLLIPLLPPLLLASAIVPAVTLAVTPAVTPAVSPAITPAVTPAVSPAVTSALPLLVPLLLPCCHLCWSPFFCTIMMPWLSRLTPTASLVHTYGDHHDSQAKQLFVLCITAVFRQKTCSVCNCIPIVHLHPLSQARVHFPKQAIICKQALSIAPIYIHDTYTLYVLDAFMHKLYLAIHACVHVCVLDRSSSSLLAIATSVAHRSPS